VNRSPASHKEVPTTVEQLLAAARAQLTRLSADQAYAAMRDGAQLIDIRSPLVLICDEGYQSSLAAATVQEFGRSSVTDVIGGFRAWRAAGLPIQPYAEKGSVMRAIDFPYGHRLEGADDDELFRKAREHVDRDHPEMERSDADIRARVAADAYDVERVA
jgi:hypothetical protein